MQEVLKLQVLLAAFLTCHHSRGSPQITDLACFCFPGDDRKTPSESNSPSSSSLSTLSDSANGKDDSDSSQKNKGGNNLLVISVVPGSQPSLNNEEKPEKGERAGCGLLTLTTPGELVWRINLGEENKLQYRAHY